MKALAKIFSVIFYLEIAVVVILSLFCFAAVPFGYKNYAVTSGSMLPTVQIGSIAYINTEIPGNEINKGDLVAFYMDDSLEKVCVHRAIAINEADQTITTKGDANADVDLSPVPFGDVVGRMDFNVPYLGFICDFFANQGIIIALIIFATALVSHIFTRLSNKKAS